MGKLVNKLFTSNKSCLFLYICMHCYTAVMNSIPLYFKNTGVSCPNWFKLSSSPSDITQPELHYFVPLLYLSLCVCVSTYYLFILLVSQTTWKTECEFKLGQKLISTSLLIKWRWQQLFLRLVSFKWACSKCLTYFVYPYYLDFLIYLMLFSFMS